MALEALLPSEIARLVYGYLVNENCIETAKSFLCESPNLQECRDVLSCGKHFSTRVCGFTLLKILEKFCIANLIVQEKIDTHDNSDKLKQCKDFVDQIKLLVEQYEGQKCIPKLNVHTQTTFIALNESPSKSRKRYHFCKDDDKLKQARHTSNQDIQVGSKENCNKFQHNVAVETTLLENLPGYINNSESKISSNNEKTGRYDAVIKRVSTQEVDNEYDNLSKQKFNELNKNNKMLLVEESFKNHTNIDLQTFKIGKQNNLQINNTTDVIKTNLTNCLNLEVQTTDNGTRNFSHEININNSCGTRIKSVISEIETNNIVFPQNSEIAQPAECIELLGDFTLELLNRTEIHEKIADNINKVFHPLNFNLNEKSTEGAKEEPSKSFIIDFNKAVEVAVNKTENDPEVIELLNAIIVPDDEVLSKEDEQNIGIEIVNSFQAKSQFVSEEKNNVTTINKETVLVNSDQDKLKVTELKNSSNNSNSENIKSKNLAVITDPVNENTKTEINNLKNLDSNIKTTTNTLESPIFQLTHAPKLDNFFNQNNTITSTPLKTFTAVQNFDACDWLSTEDLPTPNIDYLKNNAAISNIINPYACYTAQEQITTSTHLSPILLKENKVADIMTTHHYSTNVIKEQSLNTPDVACLQKVNILNNINEEVPESNTQKNKTSVLLKSSEVIDEILNLHSMQKSSGNLDNLSLLLKDNSEFNRFFNIDSIPLPDMDNNEPSIKTSVVASEIEIGDSTKQAVKGISPLLKLQKKTEENNPVTKMDDQGILRKAFIVETDKLTVFNKDSSTEVVKSTTVLNNNTTAIITKNTPSARGAAHCSNKRMSLSTPKKPNNYIRALNFDTPINKSQSESKISEYRICDSPETLKRSLKEACKSSLFQSPSLTNADIISKEIQQFTKDTNVTKSTVCISEVNKEGLKNISKKQSDKNVSTLKELDISNNNNNMNKKSTKEQIVKKSWDSDLRNLLAPVDMVFKSNTSRKKSKYKSKTDEKNEENEKLTEKKSKKWDKSKRHEDREKKSENKKSDSKVSKQKNLSEKSEKNEISKSFKKVKKSSTEKQEDVPIKDESKNSKKREDSKNTENVKKTVKERKKEKCESNVVKNKDSKIENKINVDVSKKRKHLECETEKKEMNKIIKIEPKLSKIEGKTRINEVLESNLNEKTESSKNEKKKQKETNKIEPLISIIKDKERKDTSEKSNYTDRTRFLEIKSKDKIKHQKVSSKDLTMRDNRKENASEKSDKNKFVKYSETKAKEHNEAANKEIKAKTEDKINKDLPEKLKMIDMTNIFEDKTEEVDEAKKIKSISTTVKSNELNKDLSEDLLSNTLNRADENDVIKLSSKEIDVLNKSNTNKSVHVSDEKNNCDILEKMHHDEETKKVAFEKTSKKLTTIPEKKVEEKIDPVNSEKFQEPSNRVKIESVTSKAVSPKIEVIYDLVSKIECGKVVKKKYAPLKTLNTCIALDRLREFSTEVELETPQKEEDSLMIPPTPCVMSPGSSSMPMIVSKLNEDSRTIQSVVHTPLDCPLTPNIVLTPPKMCKENTTEAPQKTDAVTYCPPSINTLKASKEIDITQFEVIKENLDKEIKEKSLTEVEKVNTLDQESITYNEIDESSKSEESDSSLDSTSTACSCLTCTATSILEDEDIDKDDSLNVSQIDKISTEKNNESSPVKVLPIVKTDNALAKSTKETPAKDENCCPEADIFDTPIVTKPAENMNLNTKISEIMILKEQEGIKNQKSIIKPCVVKVEIRSTKPVTNPSSNLPPSLMLKALEDNNASNRSALIEMIKKEKTLEEVEKAVQSIKMDVKQNLNKNDETLEKQVGSSKNNPLNKSDNVHKSRKLELVRAIESITASNSQIQFQDSVDQFESDDDSNSDLKLQLVLEDEPLDDKKPMSKANRSIGRVLGTRSRSRQRVTKSKSPTQSLKLNNSIPCQEIVYIFDENNYIKTRRKGFKSERLQYHCKKLDLTLAASNGEIIFNEKPLRKQIKKIKILENKNCEINENSHDSSDVNMDSTINEETEETSKKRKRLSRKYEKTFAKKKRMKNMFII